MSVDVDPASPGVSGPPATPPRGAAVPGRHALVASLLAAGLFAGCAGPAQRFEPVPPDYAWRLAVSPVDEWQQRLGSYLVEHGAGDPGALSQLPLLRAPTALRPGRIVFGVTDVDAVVADRDGYDVYGLLLERVPDPAGAWYLFVVGTIERNDYRPRAVADVRLAALSMRQGRPVWATGRAEAQSLERYRQWAGTATALRFPGDRDGFRVYACAARLCVEESGSGGVWSIDLGTQSLPNEATTTSGRSN
jgi:hypothetical protein